MELQGKIIQLLPVVTGQGKNGEWRKQGFIIELPDPTYPKKLCLSLWGDKIPEPMHQVGVTVKVNFDIESREYNSRWYTECKAWKIEVDQAQQVQQQQEQAFQKPAASQTNATPVEDDLPF